MSGSTPIIKFRKVQVVTGVPERANGHKKAQTEKKEAKGRRARMNHIFAL